MATMSPTAMAPVGTPAEAPPPLLLLVSMLGMLASDGELVGDEDGARAGGYEPSCRGAGGGAGAAAARWAASRRARTKTKSLAHAAMRSMTMGWELGMDAD
jgi:hypothetical protein